MKKKIILGIAAAGTALALVPMFAAFEAHVVNVTATITNAFSVSPAALTFGTVFPQESLAQPITISLSADFADPAKGNTGATSLAYMIKQKPKCALNAVGLVVTNPTLLQFGQVIEVGTNPVTFACADETNYDILPLLCPYLSKDPIDAPAETSEHGISAFHGPITIAAWTDAVSDQYKATGVLTKVTDNSDRWNIDLKVPCFTGECAQDWPTFVHNANPNATPPVDPNAYIQPSGNKGALFGCDLWVESTAYNP